MTAFLTSSMPAPCPVPMLGALTWEEARMLAENPRTCVLLPVGSVEPHGPHLPLATDAIISEVTCQNAALSLLEKGIVVAIAPTVPYGVTDFARGFAGAVGLSAATLTTMLEEIVGRLLADRWGHVCIVNNHLEPAQDAAIRAVPSKFDAGRVSVACPLERRFGRTLSDEFKSGACHAGRYETSLVLASNANTVRAAYKHLPELDASLSVGIREGKTSFAEIGMDRAYTGSPAEATPDEGNELYAKLVQMVVTSVTDGMGMLPPRRPV